MEKIEAPISNYYGTPHLVEREGRFFLGLENFDGDSEVEVSAAFAKAWTKEFKEKPTKKEG